MTKKIEYHQESEIKEIKVKYDAIKSQNENIKIKQQNQVISQIDDEQMVNKSLINLEVDEVNNDSLLFDFDDINTEQMINESLINLQKNEVNSDSLSFDFDEFEQMINESLINLEVDEVNNGSLLFDFDDINTEQIVSINQSINLLLANDNYNLSFQGENESEWFDRCSC